MPPPTTDEKKGNAKESSTTVAVTWALRPSDWNVPIIRAPHISTTARGVALMSQKQALDMFKVIAKSAAPLALVVRRPTAVPEDW